MRIADFIGDGSCRPKLHYDPKERESPAIHPNPTLTTVMPIITVRSDSDNQRRRLGAGMQVSIAAAESVGQIG